jgi:hypothetical protein
VKNLERKGLAGKIALDLIGYVLLAAALGVVTAVVLASVALLFASQAEAAQAPQQRTLLLRPQPCVARANAIDELKDRGGELADRSQPSSLASARGSPASAARQAP